MRSLCGSTSPTISAARPRNISAASGGAYAARTVGPSADPTDRRSFLQSCSRPCIAQDRFIKVKLGLTDVAPVLVLLFEVLIIDERLFRRVLLLTTLRNFFILFRNFSILQLLKLLVIVIARSCLILTPRVKLTLEDLCMRQLVRIVCQ